MKLTQEGIDLIKSFEGCRLTSYPDPATGGKPYTIGYGCTGKDIGIGMTITQEQAEAMLMDRLNKLSHVLDKILTREVNPNQFSALLSLAYNIGIGALERSTLLGFVNAGQFAPASEQFMRWDRASGVVMRGLQIRRAAEKVLFNKPM